MDDNQQNVSKLKEGAKTAANLAAKKASSAILKYVGVALLPILPYIIGVILIIVVFTVMYFGIAEQANEILTGTEELTERVANAISGYGFRNEEQVEIQEENRFYKQASLYQKLFKLSDYEIILVQQTLLYEANNEDRIYFTDNSDSVDENKDFELDDYDSVIGTITGFIKAYNISYVQGFTNAFMSSSKFKKKNKIMHEPIAAVIKCKLETGEVGGQDRFSNCYKGYLNADYDVIIDALVRFGYLSYNIKKDYLTLDNSWIYDLLFGPSEIPALFEELVKKFNSLIDTLSRQVSKYIPTFGVWNAFYQSWSDHNASLRKIANILIRGTLAEGASDEHYFYEGYIASHLKEFYKSEYDEGIDYVKLYFDGEITKEELVKKAEKEIALKEMISQDIIDYVNTYYILEYGDAYFMNLDEKSKSEILASNESNASVIIDADGNSISFDDYVLIYSLAKYGDQIKEIIDSGQNVDERLRALMIIARTQIYDETGFNHSSAEVNGDSDIYESGKKIYDSFKEDSNLHKYLENLSASISGSRGKTIKINGQVITLTPEQIDQVLDAIQNGGAIEDVIKDVIPDASLNVTFSPLPPGSFYQSSEYGEVRGSDIHKAIDYAASEGTQIYSVSDGVVTSVVNDCTVGDTNCGGGYGNRVYVLYTNGDGNNYYVIYAHMSATSNISVGQQILAGTLLGYVGNTGDSHGNHLHFEIRKNSTDSNKFSVDPSTIFDMNFGG